MRRTKENWWQQFRFLWLFSNFYQNNSKNAQRNVWKVLSASNTVSPPPENRLRKSEDTGRGWTLILSCCKWANGFFPSNFCKILWVGGNKHEMEPYCLGTGALHLNFLLLCLKYNSQPWGEGSSPLFPTRYPSWKAKGCILSEARLHLCSQTEDIGNATPAPQNSSTALNQSRGNSFPGLWLLCACTARPLRRYSGVCVQKKQGTYCLVLHFGCQWRSVLENQVYLYLDIPWYTQAYFQTPPTEQYLQLCYSVISSGLLFELLYQMQCFKHTSYYEAASLPFQPG